jgi:tetratricopeptide (TPR) repeat protein
MGGAHLALGEHKEALRAFAAALAAFDRAGARRDCVIVLCRMAEVYGWEGQYDECLRLYRDADSRCVDEDERMNVCTRMGELATWHVERGEYEVAVGLYRECLRINEIIGDRVGFARTKFNIGYVVLQGMKQPATALTFLQEAADEFEEEGHSDAALARQMIAVCRTRLGEAS